jgi:DNA polymerase III sliding clamp (beta) subunit (PCNA family)
MCGLFRFHNPRKQHTMKPITLPMAELKPALSGLSKLIRKSGLPVLKTIKVERTAEGWITLTATDLDAFATVRLEQPAPDEPFTILVPHEELARTVKTCAKNDNILVAPGAKDTGYIQYGLGTQLAEIEFESLPVTEFPEAPYINAAPIPLSEMLRTSIRQAFECSSTDPSRLILNGVCLDVSNAKAHYVVGTDGRHLFSSNSFSLPLKNSLIIPKHPFLEWSVFNADGEWQLRLGMPEKDKLAPLQITSRRWHFVSHPREGNYPNWRHVVPANDSAATTVEVDAQKLDAVLQTIKRMPCHDPVNATIGVANTGGKFHLLGKSTATADWTRVPIEDARCTGKDTTVFLNRELLSKALGFGLACMDIIDATSPLRLSNGGRQMIIMPIRTESANAKPAPSPAPAAEQNNPPPQPAEQPKEEPTMPEDNTTGAKRTPETKPALDTALAQLEVVRGDFRNAIAGLNKLGELLRQSQRETKASGKEIESVRQTLRSLQSVRI